ncbi:Npt1/Npt2 family nucleotide transporter [Winogradskyella forsetii]|nr:Npt1/Npt2 family nucleotide transporter [Winogradskyella forsetii]
MLTYIFLIIATLLIVKPTVNALFLSELGIESLPFAFLLVAVTAIFSSYFYSRSVQKFALNKIIESTLIASIILLIGLGILLKFQILNVWILYFFYVWVAIYAVLSASQFWVLANLVYNVREAKRLFGFIGSGAIMGGIFGGYLASLLAPIIGVEYLVFIAAFLLALCIPLLRKIWQNRVEKLNIFKQKKRTLEKSEHPFHLLKKSKHLTYLAGIVAISVLVAKLVEYLYSDFASSTISDADDLTSFFAFWFSTFNLISLVIQLFLTHRIVGVWGVGFSLLLLPLGVLISSILFLFIPELAIVIIIKAVDGTLKQSINKSAIELLALPLPFELKNKTKSFIDVVVDSLATGIAGCVLIFVVKGLELNTSYITGIVIVLLGIWIYFVYKVRAQYFKTFRTNLELITDDGDTRKKRTNSKSSVVKGMKTVFESGSESQILFMLKKLQEINDIRFEKEVQQLLHHPSNLVKTAAIQNMYFLNSTSVVTEVSMLLNSDYDDLVIATLDYLLLHSSKNNTHIFDIYLDHTNANISEAALYCLAKESRNNFTLKKAYHLENRIQQKITDYQNFPEDRSALILILRTIGTSDIKTFYPFLLEQFSHSDAFVVNEAIAASGVSMHSAALPKLLPILDNKKYRAATMMALINFGPSLLPYLQSTIKDRKETHAYFKHIPAVMAKFNPKEASKALFNLIEDKDLNIRLAVIRALNQLKEKSPKLKMNQHKVVSMIFDECKLYHKTLAAMHSQIIISYRNRKKTKELISSEEREARSKLLDLLERRLDNGLERIFKLLGLKYTQKDVEVAYTGLMSEKQEAQANAIEFLDSMLTGDLKRSLLPIIENTVLDVTSEDVIQKIQHKIPTEFECFQLLLNANDAKIKMSVLDLITQQKDPRYLPLVEDFILHNSESKLITMAQNAKKVLKAKA